MAQSFSSSVHRYGFVLTPNFALICYANAIEPLRAANTLAGTQIYESIPLSFGGRPVGCSSGFDFACRDIATDGASCHTIFVVAGGNPIDWRGMPEIYPTLRRLARQGVRIGGISSGSYMLAEAGMLDGREFTIHWEHAPVLREAFPELQPRQARFVVDQGCITCGGGIAPLDMMHAIIGDRMGPAFARRVSDWLLHTAVARSSGPQKSAAPERFGTHHPVLLKALETMEGAIERPHDRVAISRLVGVSPRHLDRLFSAYLGKGFLESYRAMRLDHARKLLAQSPLSISEIAFATGFSSGSHFARAYKQHFGSNPKSARLTQAKNGSARKTAASRGRELLR